MRFGPRLETAIVESRALVKVGYPWWLRPWLARDVIAITLGRRIYLSSAMASRAEHEIERLLRHELTHVRQAMRLGAVGFLVRYGLEFVQHYRVHRNVTRAYRAISFEIEAWAAEEASGAAGFSPPSGL